MAWLYDITLTRSGVVTNHGSVHAVPRPTWSLCGHFAHGALVGPDFTQARECLPYRLRQAFDRASPWFGQDAYAVAELWSSDKRRFLGTVRFKLRWFEPQASAA